MTEETHQTIEGQAQPELKQILGALLFASRKQISTGELRGILEQVAQNGEVGAHAFAKIKESDIRAALEQVKAEIAERKLGIILVEVAGGFRLQTDPAGGPWVRQLLNLDKPAHLSKPALETLAIIAYRQPITRAEIEALRGVNVDAMMRHLLELQLIRIMGRSDLPGRPLMYGTTQLFLEHFGLGSVNNLPGIEQLSRRDAEHVRREKLAQASAPAAEGGLPAVASVAKAGGQTTDAGHQTTDAGLPTDSSTTALATVEAAGAKAGGQTADGSQPMAEDDGRLKTEEANADLSAIALATAEHPTLLRPSASKGKLPNAQRRREERTEDGSANGTHTDKEDAGSKDQDEAETGESDEEDPEEYDDEDEDEDEDDEDDADDDEKQ